MQILDTPLSAPESKPIWSNVLRFGAFTGLGYILALQLFYHLGLNEASLSGMLLTVSGILLVSCSTVYFAIKKQRDQLDGGFIGFGKALLISTLTLYLGFLILDIWNYFFINYIEPDYISNLKQQTIEIWTGKIPQQDLDRSLSRMDNMNQFSVILEFSLISQSPIGIIAGGVIAIFMARKFKH